MNDALNTQQINQFINDGYVCLENAFPESIAAECRNILWKDLGLSPNQPESWTKPVIRLGMYTQEPFIEAANTPLLHQAFSQLTGSGNWIPCTSMGTFPIRFPSNEDPGDTGWHVDASYPGNDPGNYFAWRVNIKSKGRALLMLFLFSDVGEHDAPTRIRIGSHHDVAKALLPHGNTGMSFMELATALGEFPERRESLATGRAGTVYLCHPFIVHSAQPHHGQTPKFMAQPPLLLRNELNLTRTTHNTPLEKAIIKTPF